MARSKAEAARQIVEEMERLDNVLVVNEYDETDYSIRFEVDRTLALGRFDKMLSEDPLYIEVVVSGLGMHKLYIREN